MSDLNTISNGAALIRNGVIHDVGQARRVENLAAARLAVEIDAGGRVVMPAFTDPDAALVVPPPQRSGPELRDGNDNEPYDYNAALRIMSRKRAENLAAATAASRLIYGCLTVGANTAVARDLQNALKILRVHKVLLPGLRIRSIFAPRLLPERESVARWHFESVTAKWLPSIRQKKLASVLELTAEGLDPPRESQLIREMATLAAGLGYAIRLRWTRSPGPEVFELAYAAGAIAVIAPSDAMPPNPARLANIGCVNILPAWEAFEDGRNSASNVRTAIDGGAAIAIASSCRPGQMYSWNMQYILHLAVRHFGLTPEEAITALTWNAACSLRLSHAAGSLSPGKPADMLIMDVADYRELPQRAGHNDIHTLIRGGKRVSGTPQSPAVARK